MAKSALHGKESQDSADMNPADFILERTYKLEDEFKRILELGMDKFSPFYDYLDDIRIAVKKLK